jgi:hypothetical protein
MKKHAWLANVTYTQNKKKKLVRTRVTRLIEFSPIGRLFTFAFFSKSYFCRYQMFWLIFPQKTVVNIVILTKYGLGYILGDFFTKSIRPPCQACRNHRLWPINFPLVCPSCRSALCLTLILNNKQL